MFRLYITAEPVSVTAHGMNQPGIQSQLLHNRHFLDAVLFRILFKIQVVQQTHSLPERFFVPVTQFFGKVAHDCFNGQCMLNMKRLFIVLLEQSQCFGAIHMDYLLNDRLCMNHYSHSIQKSQYNNINPIWYV